eukprot:9920612-Karenia_brevis.AAC.1
MEYELDSEGDVTIGQVIVSELMFLGAAIGPALAGCAIRSKELMQLSLTGGSGLSGGVSCATAFECIREGHRE